MHQKIRNFLFLGFFLLFMMGGAYLIALAQGWAFDLNHLRIVRTGGLFLKFLPSDATLILNDKTKIISHSLVGSGVLVNNLMPAEYKVSLDKDGFLPWQKNFVVKGGIVAAATNVKLWPETMRPESVASDTVADFWLTNQGVIYENDSQHVLFQNRVLKGQKIVLADVKSPYLITLENQNYFLTDLTKPDSSLNINDLFNSLKQRELQLPGTIPIKSVFFHPFSRDKLILETENSVYMLDFSKMELVRLFTSPSLANINVDNSEVLASDANSNLLLANLVLKTTATINLGTSTEIKTMAVSPDGAHVVIGNNAGDLFLYERQSKTIAKIASSTNYYRLSPDGKELALVDKKGAFSVLFLQDYEDDFKEVAGTNLVLPLPKMGDTPKTEWLSQWPNHILVMQEQNILVSEIDSRPPLNFYTLATDAKKYILDGNNLYVLKNSGELVKFDLNQQGK